MYKDVSQNYFQDCNKNIDLLLTGSSREDYSYVDKGRDLLIRIPDIDFQKVEPQSFIDLNKVFTIDSSSVSPVFKPKVLSSLVDDLIFIDDVEKIKFEMEYDLNIKFPPRHTSYINLKITDVCKGKIKVFPDDFKYLEGEEDEE